MLLNQLAGPALMLGLVCATPSLGEGSLVKLVRVPEGGLQPQIVTDQKGMLHLIYLKGDPRACDVMYARREIGRTNFSLPVRVNSETGSAIAIGTVRGAQLALGRAGRLHVAWNGSDQAQPRSAGGSPMLYARLNDSGAGFEPQRNLMGSTRHLDGGGSVASDDQGNVYVIWHAHSIEGPQDEPHRAVFMAKSIDDGKTFAPEKRVNPQATGACGCCGLKAFADRHGRVAVVYRSATEAGGRDVTLLMSKDHGETFQFNVIGPWRVATCPMSTMALGQGMGDTLLAMWETKGRVDHASINVDSPSSASPTPEGDGESQKHPAFAMGRNGASNWLMAWTEGTGWAKGGALVWEIHGARNDRGRVEGVPVWGSVAVVAEDDGGFTIIY